MNKLSQYNYLVPYEERVIYYNGISRHVFSLDKKEHERMQELLQDLVSFEANYTSVFNRFKEWGFVIDEEVDEIDVLRFRNRKEIYSDRTYRLFINPTLECNFSCWYCYEKHPAGRMSDETMERIKKHIVYMIEQVKIDGLVLSWFGGEPLLYFDEIVYPISIFAKQLCEKYRIPFKNGATTNASKINPDMVRKMKEIDMDGFQITLDGDESRHNKIRNENGRATFRKIIENIGLLCEHLPDVYITLRINYDNQTLERSDMLSVFKMIPEQYRKNIGVDFQRVWQTGGSATGEYQKRKTLYDSCSELGYAPNGISQAFMLGRNHKCYSDRRFYAELNYDGKVYRCTARGYDDKYVLGELLEDGRIVWDEKKLAGLIGKATFENEMCLACRYLPLCLGPCSQKRKETPDENLDCICYLNDCEISPETAIIDYYKRKMDLI